ncbi:pyridoxamine 5'-phosphate oxidase [Nocardioides sp. GXQ0305]|uniref:pyridoxamine 5'-phosphate oxidase n=1 Tax=Nocardioides sp. GXQ0305 TaxID=3423912 RepID=UPI003D7D94B6
MDDLAALRREYADAGLHEADLADDPFTMFDRWFADARQAGLYEPNAMVVATVSADGSPAARMVLLKGISPRGFVFFTNLASRKGVELAGNERCALLFPWHPLERQVRVDGVASALSREEVAAYFATRPRGAQLGAHASHQSRPVADRAELMAAYDEVSVRFEGRDVPVPDEWGGYLVVPEAVEYWQGRPGRMHDRLVYRREPIGWRVERLAP